MPERVLRSFLENELARSPATRRLVVGFSGGLDSTVLLHLLHGLAARFDYQLLAVHVHHGLSPNADAWTEHVSTVCRQWQLPLEVHQVRVARDGSLEAAARAARHDAFAKSLVAGDALLLAQHEDDQAETLLFRLMRGAGVTGLGAMHEAGRFEMPDELMIPLWRPLLTVSRASLLAYAQMHDLTWVEDESNRDDRHARNFLRNRIIPRLHEHWPAATSTLAATARRLQEADALLQEMAAGLAETCMDGDRRLIIPSVLALSPAHQRLLLRYWLQMKDFLLPDESMLERIRHEVMMAREDASPCLRWRGCEIRRYRQHLYAMPPQPEYPGVWQVAWSPFAPLLLPDGRMLSADMPAGLSLPDCHVGFRRGGETLRGNGVTHDLKKLLQESGIPYWERQRLPLVFSGEELMAVVGTSLRSVLLPAGIRFTLSEQAGGKGK